MNTCANCGRVMGETEQRFFHGDRVVCGQCLGALRAQPIGYAVRYGEQKSASGLGIAALVLGILAVLVAWMPFCGLVVMPMALVGLVLGIFGIVLSRKGRTGIGMPIAGTTLCAVAIALQGVFWALMAIGMSRAAQGVPAMPGIPTPSTRPTDPTLAARYDVGQLDYALNNFNEDIGRFPSAKEGLAILVNRPAGLAAWNGPYVQNSAMVDPWGNGYVYRYPGKRNVGGYDLFSFGADGREGTGDDVKNWAK
ncbi:MAG TPA: type II secretion system protein GspG [Tepidisphaeraceae bacterium]|jgi:type II secretion system protein G|nr:type II secretion system protein GspG [Tepidisphaeraceae bacterium]